MKVKDRKSKEKNQKYSKAVIMRIIKDIFTGKDLNEGQKSMDGVS